MKPALQTLPNAISIVPAGVQDIAAIQKLAHSIWPACFRDIILPEHMENMLEKIYAPHSLMQQMNEEGHTFWLAHCEAQPVGFVSAYKDGDTIWIKKLYIEPKFQGKGIGTQMVDHAVAAFLPAEFISLLVHRENLPAQKFYLRSGFVFAGEQPVRMGDFDFVDYVYRKTITQEG